MEEDNLSNTDWVKGHRLLGNPSAIPTQLDVSFLSSWFPHSQLLSWGPSRASWVFINLPESRESHEKRKLLFQSFVPQVLSVWGLQHPHCDTWWAFCTNKTDLGCDFVELTFYRERKIHKYTNKYLIAITENALKEQYSVLQQLCSGPNLEWGSYVTWELKGMYNLVRLKWHGSGVRSWGGEWVGREMMWRWTVHTEWTMILYEVPSGDQRFAAA